jgi:hypothetical protein
VKLLIEHIKDLKAKEKVVKYIQYDNAREIVAFEQACKKEGLGVLYTFQIVSVQWMSGKKVCYCVFKIKSNTKWSKNDSGIERFVVGRNGPNK